MSIDERIDERTLREIDFPQFEAAIKKAPQGNPFASKKRAVSRNAARCRIRDSDLLVAEAGAGDPVACGAAAGRARPGCRTARATSTRSPSAST
jgi:hypothetical protein